MLWYFYGFPTRAYDLVLTQGFFILWTLFFSLSFSQAMNSIRRSLDNPDLRILPGNVEWNVLVPVIRRHLRPRLIFWSFGFFSLIVWVLGWGGPAIYLGFQMDPMGYYVRSTYPLWRTLVILDLVIGTLSWTLLLGAFSTFLTPGSRGRAYIPILLSPILTLATYGFVHVMLFAATDGSSMRYVRVYADVKGLPVLWDVSLGESIPGLILISGVILYFYLLKGEGLRWWRIAGD